MRRYRYHIITLMAAAALVAACTDSEVAQETNGNITNGKTEEYSYTSSGGDIVWSITTDNSYSTRAGLTRVASGDPASFESQRVEKDSTAVIKTSPVDVGVFGYYTGTSPFWSITDNGSGGSIKANLFVKERLTWDPDSSYWKHPTHRHWPSDSCTFMAYSPYMTGEENYESVTTNRYWFLYKDGAKFLPTAEDYNDKSKAGIIAKMAASTAYQKKWYYPDDDDSLVHLIDYKRGDTVIPAIRYILPYHLESFPDFLYGTNANSNPYKDVTHDKDCKDDYVHWKMRHALAKSYWYLTSGINLSNNMQSVFASIDNESSDDYSYSADSIIKAGIYSGKGEQFETDNGDSTWVIDKAFYKYERIETKLVVEEITFMDFYDRGTLPLINYGTPTWVDRVPNCNNKDYPADFDNPVNRAIITAEYLNDCIALRWEKYDTAYYEKPGTLNPLNQYKNKEQYENWFLVRYLDENGVALNKNFPRDKRFSNSAKDKEFSLRDTSDFKISYEQWQRWKIKHTEKKDDDYGIIETKDMIPLLGQKGELYIMNVPQETETWTPKMQLKYRTIFLDKAVMVYRYKNTKSGTLKYIYSDDYDHDNFYFYVVNRQRTSKGYFNRDLVGGRRYSMKVNLSADYLTILADIQDWDVVDITYTDEKQGVTIGTGGAISWVQDAYGHPTLGSSGTNVGKVYLNSYTGYATFEISRPKDAKWTATLITTSGKNNAFAFYDDDGNKIGTSTSGPAGEQCHIIVKATDTSGEIDEDNAAILRFFITYSDGTSELISTLTGENSFSEWTVVQQAN